MPCKHAKLRLATCCVSYAYGNVNANCQFSYVHICEQLFGTCEYFEIWKKIYSTLAQSLYVRLRFYMVCLF